MLLYIVYLINNYVWILCGLSEQAGGNMAWDLEVIDLNDALQRVMGHKTMYKSWLVKFFSDETFAPVDKAVAAGNSEEAHSALHKIKGTASNLSVMKVYRLAEDLEKRLKKGEELNSLIDEIEVLRGLFQSAKQMHGENVDYIDSFQC